MSESRMYIAFMGPPLALVHAKCSCGKTITFGKDETGWYVEGAEEILIRGSGFEKPRSEVGAQ